MAAQFITKVAVKNLPQTWSPDHLQNFLEVVTSLTVADNGIHVFRDITHTALLTQEVPLTGQALDEDAHNLTQTPFDGNILYLEPVSDWTCRLLVTYTDSGLTRDHVMYYFDNPSRSGCGDAEVTDCEMYREVFLAVVTYNQSEGVAGVIAKGNHVLKQGSEVLRVEPWYEEFHRPLVNELIHRSRPQAKPVVPPKPMLLPKPMQQCSPAKFPKPSPQPDPEIERLRREMEKLREENQKLKNDEAEKQQKAHEETVLRHKTENERLKNENEKLKKQASVSVPVPSHQLRLLTTSMASMNREGCKVTLMEQEELALFHGIEEVCEEARREFLMRLQKLEYDTIPLSEPISKILKTPRGKEYVDDMVQRYAGCAVKVCESQLQCAAICGQTLKNFKDEFQKNLMSRTCQVPAALKSNAQFVALRLRLENEFMVVITLPTTASSEDVQLDGINGDVEMAAREVDQFTNLNRSDSKRFHVAGRLQGQACKKWFTRELDEVKQLIVKNGEIEDESVDDGYTLTFQCRQEILPSVLDRLEAIKTSILLQKVDLHRAFHKHSDRMLVINGLHSRGVEVFCSHLAPKLSEMGFQSLLDFRLPAPGVLPQFRMSTGKAAGGGQRGRGGYHRQRSQQSDWSGHHGGGGGRGHHHSSSGRHRNYPSLPCSFSVGGTTITIKSGDITTEQVGAAVCVVGSDLALKGTAIGSAFLRKMPGLAQILQTNASAGGDNGGCRIVSTPTTGSGLPMPVILHAVVKKLPRNAVKNAVKGLVQQCLVLTVQSGQTSLALPPLGVGKRFGFGEYTTASTMALTLKEYLGANPNTLQNITIVVYEVRLAGKFAQIISQKMGVALPTQTAQAAPQPTAADVAPPPPPPSAQLSTDADDDNSSDTGNEDDDDDNDRGRVVLVEPDVSDVPQSQAGVFEVDIVIAGDSDWQSVKDVVLRELNTTFLWHETLSKEELDTFYRLGQPVVQEILEHAKSNHVYLSLCDKGLRLCGQQQCVSQLLALVREKIVLHFRQQKEQVWDKRSGLGLPKNTDRLPSYWKVCRKEKDLTVSYEKAYEAWQKRGVKLNSVTPEERAEIERLLQACWEADKAGAGKDARSLTHTKIKMVNVKRLENPYLWNEYSNRREQLFTKLERICTGRPPPAQFATVDTLPGSRSAIKTTANITQGSPLSRDIYPQVNEHYLFHGTKKDVLQKILQQGLDFRMSSSRTMLGSGVYAAESSTKADQYTDEKANRTSGVELTMILMRMLLGQPFIHKEQNPQAFKRPPCLSCSQRQCACPNAQLFNSVIDDVRIFREFVVYDQSVCYPEYVITYRRE